MAKHTIGRWPVVVSRLKVIRAGDSRAGLSAHTVRCKNHDLGDVWKSPRRNTTTPWRAQHARNRAISFHRTMAEAIVDIVCTETQFPTQEYR